MLSDPFPQSNVKPPNEVGTSTMSIFMYSEDVDAAIQKAVDAGATVTTPAEDMFWGDRFGTITDPYGHLWAISTHVEDIPPEEVAKGGEAAMAEMMS